MIHQTSNHHNHESSRFSRNEMVTVPVFVAAASFALHEGYWPFAVILFAVAAIDALTATAVRK